MHPEMDAPTFQSETLASRFSDTFATPPPASCEQPVAPPSEVVPSVPPPPDTVRDLAALADPREDEDGADLLLTDWLDRPSPVPEAIEEVALPIARSSPPGWSLLAAACAVVGAAALMVGLSRPPAAAPIVASKVVTTSAPLPTPTASASTASAPASSAASTASASARPSQAHRTAPAPKVAPRVRPLRGNAEAAAAATKSSSLYGRD